MSMDLFQKKISAVKVPHHKNTAEMQSVIAPPPTEVLIPTNMHSGDAAIPIVQPGDHVFLGQLIAKEEGKNSSPVHATVSGTVKAVEAYKLTGRPAQAIRIESDGKMERDPTLAPPQVSDLDFALGFTVGAPQQRTHAQQQFIEIHRLDHVIVNSQPERLLLCGKIFQRRDEEKGNLFVYTAYRIGKFKSVGNGHHDIGNDEVERIVV